MRTDMMTLIITFRNFATAPKKHKTDQASATLNFHQAAAVFFTPLCLLFTAIIVGTTSPTATD
jgi:hypothetical protein